MKKILAAVLILLGTMVGLAVEADAPDTPPTPRVSHYTLVGVQQVGPQQYDFAFRAEATNRSRTDFNPLVMQLTLAPNSGATVVKGTLNFGHVVPGQTVSSLDEFVLEFPTARGPGADEDQPQLTARLARLLQWTVAASGPATVAVPAVTGLTQAAATTSITGAGLTLGPVTQSSSTTVSSGSVISETPAAGTLVALGSAVNLVVSNGPPMVAIPAVTGMTQAAATTAITAAGLTVGTVTQAPSTTVALGNVISESPIAGTSVVLGSAVSLLISSGPPQVAVPAVTGLTQSAASSAITGAGLIVGTVTQAPSSTVPSGSVISETPVAGTLVTLGSAVNLLVSTGPALVAVPDVTDLAQAAATTSITSAGLTLGTVSPATSTTVVAGNVISESPVAGTLVPPGTAVNLVVSSGPPMVTVPAVTGMTQAAASTALTGAGLITGTVTQASSTTVASGLVISESPVAGTSVAVGSAVSLVISTGAPSIAVPDVTGQTQAAATSLLTNAGLTVGTISQAYSTTVVSGNVISESPVAGTLVAPGSAVSLTLSAGVAPVVVPNVVGLTQAAASTTITNAGLTVGTVTFAASATVPSGNVISENPAAGAAVAPASTVSLQVSTGTGLPPDPASIAPPIDPTVATNLFTATAFLYTGTNPIQTGVAPGTIDLKRAAVMRGKVLGTDGLPITGVQITVVGHPEFGQTLSRADGMYDLAVNGGGPLSVRFDKTGYPTAHRQVNVRWNDYAPVPDVILTAYDVNVTQIDTAATTIQVARGSSVTDADGTRQSTLMFSPGTSLIMVTPAGAAVTLNSFHVRATEFTVGPNGHKAMPADLPPASGYTYAVELSVDEGVAAGAKLMDFNQPVVNYLENFLGFPVGSAVPVGYFDRDKAVWVASANGLVVKVLATTGGVATLDVDGAGIAATATELTALGITTDELTQLAQLYQPGQGLWRAALLHFTLYDANNGTKPPDGSTTYTGADPDPGNKPPVECVNGQGGSIIGCENQSLGETLSVTGTPWQLNYRSNRTPGYNNSLNITLSGATLPPSLKRIDLEIDIAGRQILQSFPASPNQSYTFTFDGLDAYGRTVQGPQSAVVRIGYVYPSVYMTPSAQAGVAAAMAVGSFGHFTYFGIPASTNQQRTEIILWAEYGTSAQKPIQLGAWDSRASGLGGWTLDVQHSYDSVSHTLFLGNGQQRNAQAMSSVIKTVAGGAPGAAGFTGDGIPATSAWVMPHGVAVGPDGSIYLAETGYNRIRRVGPDGIITTVAGSGTTGFSGDGGLATAAQLNSPYSVALGPDGSLYISDSFNRRIRHVGLDGIITTVAGNGTGNFVGGVPATSSGFDLPVGVAVGPEGNLYIADDNQTASARVSMVTPDGIINSLVGPSCYLCGGFGDGGLASAAGVVAPDGVAVGPDGSVYIADAGDNRIRRVTPDGKINTFAGTRPGGFGGDGGLATAALLAYPRAVAVAADGTVYIADWGNDRVRRVGTDGIINTVAGNGVSGFSGDGGPAIAAKMALPIGVAVGPDGSVYVTDYYNSRIRRVDASAMPVLDMLDAMIPSEDGRELYIFNGSGRHLQTLDALTGAVRYQFAYSTGGYLTSITDGSGNVTTVERSGVTPSAIVAPGGQRTTLTVDTNGWLATAADPAGDTYAMTYSAGGLLQTFTDPRANLHNFTYDTQGFLTQDLNPAGGSVSLARTVLSNGYKVTTTSALGRTHTYQVEQLPTGSVRRTVTSASGTQTVTLINTDGSRQTTYADGSTMTAAYGPDPRFGMLAPVPTSTTITTPGGLTRTITTARTASLSNPANLLSLTNLTETVTDNGTVSSSVFANNGVTRTITGTSAAGRSVTQTLDALGRVTQSQALGLDPVSYTYDSRGLLTTITEGSGFNTRTTSLTYDASYQLVGATDALGRTLGLNYDAAGRLIIQTQPDASVIGFSYDASGNMTALTPPGRLAHNFGYTTIDQVASYTPPAVGAGTSTTQYTYDVDRALTRVTRPDGLLIDLGYDTAGRTSSVAIARGTMGFAYDPTTDHLTGISAPGGLGLSYSYDSGLTTGVAQSGAVAGTLGYTYDNFFRPTAESVNGANPVGFAYDVDGYLTTAGSLALSHNAQNGLYTGSTLGSVSDTLTYDTLAQLTNTSASFGATSLYNVAYVRDALGRISQKTETLAGVSTTYAYSYDLAGRLSGVSINNVPVASYGYDSNGNRTSYTVSAGQVTATYDAQDRLMSYGSNSYAYTANGELVNKSSGTQATGYQYDALGNLTHVALPNSAAIDYLIDGKNRRIGKLVNGVQVQGFLYKGALRPIAELDGNSAVVSRFVYAMHTNVPDYLIKGGATYRIITDQLGSPRLVVDVTTGLVAQRIDYDEFGRVLSDSNPGFQPFGFAGGLYDRDTGLVRFGARDYDAEVGRWTAKDPIRFDGGDTNVYGYVLNDPVNKFDLNGKACQDDIQWWLYDAWHWVKDKGGKAIDDWKPGWFKKAEDVKDVADAWKDPDPASGFKLLEKITKNVPDDLPGIGNLAKGVETVQTAPGGLDASRSQGATGTTNKTQAQSIADAEWAANH